MKYLLVCLILLLSLQGFSQIDYFTLTRESGTLMGMVEHRAPANPNGKKDPVILWLHGVDGNRSAPTSTVDTTRIDEVTNKGPLRLVRGPNASNHYTSGGSPLPLFQKPGTVGASERYRWNIVAPQNPFSGTNQWACDVVGSAMDYIRANPSKWDTSCIILVGYSLGGHGIKKCGTNSDVLPYVKYIVDIAGGSDNTVIGGTSMTRAEAFAASGVQMDFYITIDDEHVTSTYYRYTDSLVNRIKRSNPKVVPTYIKMKDVTQTHPTSFPEHDYMEVMVARDTIAGNQIEDCTNGDVWTDFETIFHRGLRFKGIRRLP